MAYTIDRNNKSNSAINFSGLCNGNSGYIKVPNASSIQFSNSMTISFWAKMDLSNGMSPADGTCSTTGYHMLFAKGGDGFGTSPNGIYSYLIPNGNNANHILGSTPSSGSFGYNILITNPNLWQHFSYVITTTTYKLYINGQLIDSKTHSINFSEINNQDLYIGIMGPKTTPAAGVTNWYPMTGLMDDFRIFNRELNSTEINQIYNYVETETVVNYGPTIDQIYNLGNTNGNYPYSWNVFKSKMFELENETLVSFANYNTGNFAISVSLKKLNKDTITAEINERLGSLYNNEHIPNFERNSVLKKNSKYYYFMGIDRGFSSTITADRLFILNDSLAIIERHSLGSVQFQSAFFKNDSLIVLSKNTANLGIFNVSVYDLNFNPIFNISINDSITDFSQLNSKLILGSKTKFYIFNESFSSYSIYNQGLDNLIIKNDKLLYQKGNLTTSFNLNTQVSTAISTVNSELFTNPNEGSFYLVEANVLKKYNASNQLVLNQAIPVHDKVIFHNNYFLLAKYNSSLWNITYTFLNPEGLQIAQFSTGSHYSEPNFDNIEIKDYQENKFLLSTLNGLKLINSLGETIWSKGTLTKDLKVNSDMSLWIITGGTQKDLIHLQNPSNACNYVALNPFRYSYCKETSGIIPSFTGNLQAFTSNFNTGFPVYSRNIGYGIHFDWYKDNIKIDSIYLGRFTGEGVYKVLVSQGSCQVFSESKFVSSNNDLISKPVISLGTNEICSGSSTTLTSQCPYLFTTNWLDISSTNTSRNISPTSSQTYSSFCKETERYYRKYTGHPDFASYYEYVSREGCNSDTLHSTITVRPIPFGPDISASANEICKDEVVKLTASNCLNNLNWSTAETTSSINVQPLVSTTYKATCKDSFGCLSNETATFINVKTFSNTLSLTGSPINSLTYRAGKINSIQSFNSNNSMHYKVAKSIELLPGFSSNNKLFIAEVDKKCSND